MSVLGGGIYLPIALLDDTGSVDESLLEKLWSKVTRPSSKVRTLIKEIGSTTIKPTDSAYRSLAALMKSPAFIKKWIMTSGAGNSLPCITWLITNHMAGLSQELQFNNLQKQGFFVYKDKKKKAYFFCLEKINVLIDSLRASSLDDRHLALFIWSIYCDSIAARQKYPSEPSFIMFGEAVADALKRANFTSLLAMLEPAPGSTAKEVTESDKISIPVQKSKVISREELPAKILKSAFVLDCERKLKRIGEKIELYRSIIQQVAAKAQVLLKNDGQPVTLQVLVDLAEGAQGEYRILHDECASIGGQIDVALDETLSKLGLSSSHDIPQFDISNANLWVKKTEKVIEHLTVLESAVLLFDDLPTLETLNLDRAMGSAMLPNIETAIETVRSLYKQYVVLKSGQSVETRFKKLVAENYSDLSWDIYTEARLPNTDWLDLAKYYLAIQELSPLLGALVHRNFTALEVGFAGFISQKTDADSASVSHLVNVISWLTLGQQERLARSHPGLRVLVSLVQLDGYLNCNFAKQQAFGFWSTYPLSEMYVNHDSGVIGRFFQALYILASKTSLELLPHNTLRLGISGAKALNAHRNDSMEEISDAVQNLLMYRRKSGGVTYAQIWEAAHASLFQPLYETFETRGLISYFDEYEVWLQTFDVDRHIDSWKSEIPEHLKKNSEYDKFARTQVALKKAELDHVFEVYKQLQINGSVEQDHLKNLKESISAVMRSKDKDCILIKHWLEDKLDGRSVISNLYVSHDRSTSPDLGKIEGANISALLPRAFVRNGFAEVKFSHIYTDLIIKALHYNSVEQLVEIYLDNGVYEGFSQVLSTGNASISAKLERRVEKCIEDVSAITEDALKEITQTLPLDYDGRLATAIHDIESLIENHQWRHAEAAVIKARNVAGELVQLNDENAKRSSLLEQLTNVGVLDVASSWSTDVLIAKLEEFYSLYEKQRAHIKIVEKLYQLEVVDLKNDVRQCVNYLDNIGKYPEQGVSEQTAYYWEQAVDPLVSELTRSNTLLPSYKEQLLSLVSTFLLSIQYEANSSQADSVLNSVLIDTADDWQNLPDLGKTAADRILARFESAGLIKKDDEEIGASLIDTLSGTSTIAVSPEDRTERSIALLQSAARNQRVSLPPVSDRVVQGDVISIIEAKDWRRVSDLSFEKLVTSGFESIVELSNWAISDLLSNPIVRDASIRAATLCLINAKVGGQVVRYLHNDRAGKALIPSLSFDFLCAISGTVFDAGETSVMDVAKFVDQMQEMVENAPKYSMYKTCFDLAFACDTADPVTTKVLWDKLSGGTKQAEARALFMILAWKLRAPDVLSYCLTLSPIDIDQRKSQALARIAERALASGNSELLQGFIDLRKSVSARPFHLFVDMLLKGSIEQGEQPARLSIVGDLELHDDLVYKAVLSIAPRRVDSPDSLSVKLPTNSPVKFVNNSLVHELKGPFFTDTSILLSFVLVNELASSFKMTVECESISLTGQSFCYSQELSFTLKDGHSFSALSVDEIEEVYDNFPDIHMRGDEYVTRVADEQKIEKALFKSKTVRSLWISSPRRSGKTTMLYRILDGFSHKADRDSLVVYLTLDEYYINSLEFNRWIWKRLRTISSNRELRDLYDDFDSIGRELVFDTDSGTFIGALSDQLLQRNENATRIIFLIDEIDRFATMYFQGGANKQAATDILWQIRSTINDRRDIGIVFAGSSAAKQLFIANAESPFYNSIDHLELTPFSAKTKPLEELSRKIVEPLKVKSLYDLPKESLEHLIWLCAGIPYYMKLVAGATLSRAKHSHILISDVNEGLRALLARETGISKLDDMGGEPGTDEIRTTLSIENGRDGLLAKAVLYAFSDLHSPLSGHRTYRGKISSVESKLISHYKLSKVDIDRGLDICIGLGLIKIVETDSVPELDFSIPILGESIRKSSGRLWANIDHELIGLTKVGD